MRTEILMISFARSHTQVVATWYTGWWCYVFSSANRHRHVSASASFPRPMIVVSIVFQGYWFPTPYFLFWPMIHQMEITISNNMFLFFPRGKEGWFPRICDVFTRVPGPAGHGMPEGHHCAGGLSQNLSMVVFPEECGGSKLVIQCNTLFWIPYFKLFNDFKGDEHPCSQAFCCD